MNKPTTFVGFPQDLENAIIAIRDLTRPKELVLHLPVQAMTEIMNSQSDSTVTNPDTEQIGGKHYKKCAIQPWDYVIANDLDYFQGSIIKYVTRWRDKGWTEDLHKAKHFLDKYIITMEEKYKGLKMRDIK